MTLSLSEVDFSWSLWKWLVFLCVFKLTYDFSSPADHTDLLPRPPSELELFQHSSCGMGGFPSEWSYLASSLFWHTDIHLSKRRKCEETALVVMESVHIIFTDAYKKSVFMYTVSWNTFQLLRQSQMRKGSKLKEHFCIPDNIRACS